MATFCDPPEGHRYGFPREIPEEVLNGTKELIDWLVECGYPKEYPEMFGKFFNVRFWREGE